MNRRHGNKYALLLAGILGWSAAFAENVDPAGDDTQYAYAENFGWLNAEPSGDGGPGLQVDDFEVSGWMWGENVGWVSLSCENTSSCATTGYGVANDGHGTLSGHAWAENLGWISLSCGNTSSCGTVDYGVTIDPSTGEFAGRAWAENAGWITFGASSPVAYGVKTGWCETVASPPGGLPDLAAEEKTHWSWPVVATADWYEAVRGDLSALHATGGDFSSATDGCIEDNLTVNSLSFAAEPSPGEGIWILVRGANCRGKGSHDSGGAGQTGPRDAGITGSGIECP